MIARIVRSAFFWIGIVAAVAIPFVPVILRWTSSANGGTKGFGDAIGEALGMVFYILALAAVVIAASLAAFIAAWIAGEPRRTKMLCGLPVLVGAVAYGAMVVLLNGNGNGLRW